MRKILNDHEKRIKMLENNLLKTTEQLKIQTKLMYAIALMMLGGFIKVILA